MKKRSTLQKQIESAGHGRCILQVGVIGSAGEEEYLKGWKPARGLIKTVKKIGAMLGEKGVTIITGGGGGIMKAVAQEGIKRDSITVGIFNTHDETAYRNVYTVGFTTGMFEGGPEYLLPLCSDIIIAVSGGSGTLNELTVAYRNCIPVVLLKGFGGWVDRIIPTLYEGRYLDERKRIPFFIAESAEDAVAIALKEGLKRLKILARRGKTGNKGNGIEQSGVRRISI